VGETVKIMGQQAVTPGALCKLLAVINPQTTCACELNVSNQIDAQIENVFEMEVEVCADTDLEIGPDAVAGIDYEWLSVNSSNLAALSSTTSTPTTFNFDNTTGSDIVWQYALRTSFGNCFSFDTIEVTVFPKEIVNLNVAACEGEAFTLPGPLSGSEFSWSPMTNLTPPDSNFPVLDPVPMGGAQYTVTYADANGCPAERVINIAAIGCAPNTGIGDTVWFDINEDGLQDPMEPGIPGVQVLLYNSTNTSPGSHISSTLTDANGFYAFDGLPSGNYVIQFVDPDGFVITSQNSGTGPLDSLDSDPAPGTGLTGPYFLPNGIFNPTVDAGYIPDCNVDVAFAQISECELLADGTHQRTVVYDISWSGAVYTYDFLNGSDTINIDILGEEFQIVVTELQGDTTFTYIATNQTTTDLATSLSFSLDPDCEVMIDTPGITACIYDLALIKDLPILSNIAYGDILPFEITVQNQGAQPLTQIKVNDFLPSLWIWI